MAAASPTLRGWIYPLQALWLASPVPLFLGGLLSDLTYSNTFEIQWLNFAAWLIAGGMVFTGFALLWAVVDLIRSRRLRGRGMISFLLLVIGFVFGLINSFVHARDAWATMPDGLVLSTLVLALALGAMWVGLSSPRAGEAE